MNILDNTTEPDELDVWILRLAKYANTLTPYKLDDPIDPIVQDGLNEAKKAIQAHIDEKVNEVLELIGKPEEPWKFDHYPGDYRIGYSRAIRDFEDKLRQSASRRYGE